MQSLLRWSIEHSNPQDGSAPNDTPVPNQKLDPGIIDMILGKPDAVQMKEDVTAATDVKKSEDDRLAALDHLEMLVEHIDNANDLQKLGLWQPLESLLTSPESSTEIKVQVLWVIGTAIQNNPAAQDVFLTYDPLPTLLGFLNPNSPSSTLGARAKALYALSGLLKHNAAAVAKLGKPGIDGWLKLREALQDPEISVRRKAVFLLNSLILPTAPNRTTVQHPPPPLLIASQPAIASSAETVTTHETPATTVASVTSVTARPSGSLLATSAGLGPDLHTVDEPNANDPGPIHDNSHAAHLKDPSRSDTSGISLEAFKTYGIIGAVVSAVTSPLPYGEDGDNDKPDTDFEEKSMHLFHTYGVSCHGSFLDEERSVLRQWVEKEGQGTDDLAQRWNLSTTELEALMQRLDRVG
ncbi:Fes1-domain-containing protein [Macrolepiota fuliginosa MF-IS2]|uniref:Fes1-domain-containing protein n=1 Tax=Macrolepiota fuliginosa MF-IS2 TaxID=1400762 RepID=A0A9P5XLX9_9AGAR|nr:Fes1-domain-containing protein [Macrolepiota fuliginosa MF-IS2]